MGNVQTKESPNALAMPSSGSRRASTGEYNHPPSASPRNGPSATTPHNSSRHRSSSLLNPSTTRNFSSFKGPSHNAHSSTPRLVLCPSSQMVDEGFLVPQGIYTSPQDFDFAIVQELIIQRRLAPFYRGLADFDEDWSERELLRALRVGHIQDDATKADTEPAAIPNTTDKPTATAVNISSPPIHNSTPQNILHQALDDMALSHSAPYESSLPQSSPPQSTTNPNQATTSSSASLSTHTSSPPAPSSATTSNISIGRTRANTTTRYVTTTTENNGPSISHEIAIYSHALECPICFLYYPPTTNFTRCCQQPICTECFVQIKRAEPHTPHDTVPTTVNANPNPDSDELISEPACCPYCAQSDFGVTFTPPTIRTGALSNTAQSKTSSPTPAQMILSPSSVSSTPTQPPGKRRSSIPVTQNSVITIDKIRPSWCTTLAAARVRKARKSAHASQLHATMANGATEIEVRMRNRGSSSNACGNGTMTAGRAGDISKREWRELAKQQELEDIMLAEAMRLSLLED
ncbi:hypothetical protein NADFUDRAFT_52228 [Nadsonia fulvescens var. elongata DSM 6958]|uniref:Uncharacterized protein n=1 Tax=Nadsonia fulvescens var. elongata DSM 6958 TaxID=857566 RepID=A0A1E3PHA6_9ASCO|nr:hypothetical protein NADFUDRAFT_52228 [Nadsonia fulvescens var. elongata DSM 6958]